MPVPERLSPSLHDLPTPLRAKIGQKLPVKSIAALRATAKHTFDEDTVAYLGVEDRAAEIALTMRHPHLRQLVRGYRDGAVAEDAALHASRAALEAPEAFASACTAAEAEKPDVQAIVRPLLLERAKGIALRGERARAAAELMRTAESRAERDEIMDAFHPELAPRDRDQGHTDALYHAAFSAADSAEERGARFAMLDAPSPSLFGAYIDAVRTPEEHEHIVGRYAETVENMFEPEYSSVSGKLLAKDLADPLLRRLVNLDVHDGIKVVLNIGIAQRPIPDDVRASILAHEFCYEDTLKHLARFADSQEARLAVGQARFSGLGSTRAILYGKTENIAECKELLASCNFHYLEKGHGEACMTKARSPEDVYWVVQQSLLTGEDLLRNRLFTTESAEERSALIERFTTAGDSAHFMSAGNILAEFAGAPEDRRRVMHEFGDYPNVGSAIVRNVQSFDECKTLFAEKTAYTDRNGVEIINLCAPHQSLTPQDWAHIWSLARTPEDKLWVAARTTSPEVLQTALRSAGARSERARIFASLKYHSEMLYTVGADEAETKREQLAVVNDEYNPYRKRHADIVNAAVGQTAQRSAYPAVRLQALRTLPTGSADWDGVAERATTARERAYVHYALSDTRMRKLQAALMWFGC